MKEENKNMDTQQDVIDLGEIFKSLWAQRKKFFIMWAVVFALACLWVFPKPRYYNCEVKLAPEGGTDVGGLAGIAADFGFNLGGGVSADAIYPLLYPDLFESPEFIVDLLSIQVETYDHQYKGDYYTYLRNHQQKNWLTEPFNKLSSSISKMLEGDEEGAKTAAAGTKKQGVAAINPFELSKKEMSIVNKVIDNINCTIDKKTDVISIEITDQDRRVCALLADSIRVRLQNYIISYRTRKVRQDEQYYKHLTDSARLEYEKVLAAYGAFKDGHQNVVLESYVGKGDKIKNELDMKLSAYNTFKTQYTAMKAKVQERTPSFTTLKSATIPLKPAGPKRIMFIASMLILSTMGLAVWLSRKQLHFEF